MLAKSDRVWEPAARKVRQSQAGCQEPEHETAHGTAPCRTALDHGTAPKYSFQQVFHVHETSSYILDLVPCTLDNPPAETKWNSWNGTQTQQPEKCNRAEVLSD